MKPAELAEKKPTARRFHCEWSLCHRSFSRKHNLWRHSKIHTNERPYSCLTPGCNKSFIQRSALTAHTRRHTSEKPHQCHQEECGSRLSEQSALNKHRRIHPTERLCKKKDTVLRHLRQSPHEEENSLDPEGGDTSHSDTEESPSTSQLRAQAQHDLKNTYNAVDSSSHLMGVSDDDDGYPPQHDLASSIGRVHCKYPGCSHSYLRAEHLTRHHLTHEVSALQCCLCSKPFSRNDLLRAHAKRHEKRGNQATGAVPGLADSRSQPRAPQLRSAGPLEESAGATATISTHLSNDKVAISLKSHSTALSAAAPEGSMETKAPKHGTCNACSISKVKCGRENPSCNQCSAYVTNCVYSLSGRMAKAIKPLYLIPGAEGIKPQPKRPFADAFCNELPRVLDQPPHGTPQLGVFPIPTSTVDVPSVTHKDFPDKGTSDFFCSKSRKRACASPPRKPIPSVPSPQVQLGDRKALSTFYEQCLSYIQQCGCKVLGKAWVKLLEPRKKSRYPYNGKYGVPPWWPPLIRHKEPDALYMEERLVLLVHILGIIVDHSQNTIPTLRDVDVRKLKEATRKPMSTWFKKKPNNAEKKPFLNELFRILAMEERYQRGELDAITSVIIPPSDDDDDDKPSPLSPTTLPTGSSLSSFHPSLPITTSASPFSNGSDYYPTCLAHRPYLPPTPEINPDDYAGWGHTYDAASASILYNPQQQQQHDQQLYAFFPSQNPCCSSGWGDYTSLYPAWDAQSGGMTTSNTSALPVLPGGVRLEFGGGGVLRVES